MNALTVAALLAGPVFPAYPLPAVVANGPAPMFTSAEDAALCEDALWVDVKGLPQKPKDQSRYNAAREVCDKAKDSLEPGVRVIVEGSFTLTTPHPGLAAFRVQGLVVGLPDTLLGYVGVVDFWVPANRIQVQSPKMTTEEEQKALWRRLVGKQ